MKHDNELLQAAVAAVAHAAPVARSVQGEHARLTHLMKSDRSPVTVADYAVQAIVALELNERLEDVFIAGEESADELEMEESSKLREAVTAAVRLRYSDVSEEDVLAAIRACDHDGSAEAYWTLDPIDGTRGFLRGRQYALSLAFIEDGSVTIGVLGCPNLPLNQSVPLDEPDRHGALYSAIRGYGAWEARLDDAFADPNRLRRLEREPGAAVHVCESVESGHSSHEDSHRVLERLSLPLESVRLDSQCKYALVARDQADVYLRMPTGGAYVEKIWDHAPGMLIAQEAGAVVTDITGSPLDFTTGRRLEHNRGIVCAAKEMHGELIQAVESLGLN